MGKKIIALMLTLMMVFSLVPHVAFAADGDNTPGSSDPPVFQKKLKDNGDGTYTLSLSVTGETDTSTITNVNKANVILVIDTSSSMNNDAAAGTTADPHVYYEVPGTPGNPSTGGVSATYFRLDGTTYRQVYYRNGNWYTSQTGGTQFNGQFYARSRFWAEYHALTDEGGIIDSLLARPWLNYA